MTPRGFKITTLHAFIATEDDGTEGVMGFQLADGAWYPMVCADRDRIESYRPIAQRICTEFNKTCVIAKFSVREDVDIISP